MLSPTFLSQRVTVPSLTDSPSAGIVITVPPDVAAGAAGAAAGGGVGAGVATTGASTTGVGVGVGGEAGVTGAAADASVEIMASSAPTATV